MEISIIGPEKIVLPEDQGKAVKKFGRTEDPLEARFILSDGSFLYIPGFNGKDHYKIHEIYPKGIELEGAILKFMNTGAIKFAKWGRAHSSQLSAFAEITRIPNDNQIITMKKNMLGLDRIALDLTNSEDGRRIFSVDFQIPRALDIHDFIARAKEGLR